MTLLIKDVTNCCHDGARQGFTGSLQSPTPAAAARSAGWRWGPTGRTLTARSIGDGTALCAVPTGVPEPGRRPLWTRSTIAQINTYVNSSRRLWTLRRPAQAGTAPAHPESTSSIQRVSH